MNLFLKNNKLFSTNYKFEIKSFLEFVMGYTIINIFIIISIHCFTFVTTINFLNIDLWLHAREHIV